MAKKKDEDLIKEIKDRFGEAYDAADHDYTLQISDLEFLANEDNCQWPITIKNDRISDGRPCLTVNKLPAFCKQVTGDLRRNSPSIKVKPVDSEADPDTAEKMTGLIRNIEVQSVAEVAYDTAVQSAVHCGIGRFRVVTEYAGKDIFDQNIRIKRIKNPFTVFWDPASQEYDKTDAMYCFITEKMSRDEFGRQWPNASMQEFKSGKDQTRQWGDDKTIRVAEYFKKVPDKKTIYLLKNPATGESYVYEQPIDGWEVENSRECDSYKIEWYKTNGIEILEGPTVLAGEYIPIIDVYGDELHIENRTILSGLIRHAKDPQRLYNYSRSHNAEVTALAPKAPYLVTEKMIGPYQRQWDQAHKKNYPYLPYVVDPDATATGGKPFREPPIQVNSGILSEIQIADQEIHDTTGLQLASLGKVSNEKSGVAIRERRSEGDRGSFHYGDNLKFSLMTLGKILIDLIPKIYDTPRIERILGEDGAEEMVQFNQEFQDKQTGEPRIFDLTVGKYDIIASVGPSYQTQREEAVDGMVQLFSALPDNAKMLIMDLIVKNLDWPGSDDIVERLKAMLPPEMADPDAPPQPPPPPDPVQMLEIEKSKADVQKTLIEVQKIKAEIDKILAESRKTRSDTVEKEMEIDGVLPNQMQ